MSHFHQGSPSSLPTGSSVPPQSLSSLASATYPPHPSFQPDFSNAGTDVIGLSESMDPATGLNNSSHAAVAGPGGSASHHTFNYAMEQKHSPMSESLYQQQHLQHQHQHQQQQHSQQSQQLQMQQQLQRQHQYQLAEQQQQQQQHDHHLYQRQPQQSSQLLVHPQEHFQSHFQPPAPPPPTQAFHDPRQFQSPYEIPVPAPHHMQQPLPPQQQQIHRPPYQQHDFPQGHPEFSPHPLARPPGVLPTKMDDEFERHHSQHPYYQHNTSGVEGTNPMLVINGAPAGVTGFHQPYPPQMTQSPIPFQAGIYHHQPLYQSTPGDHYHPQSQPHPWPESYGPPFLDPADPAVIHPQSHQMLLQKQIPQHSQHSHLNEPWGLPTEPQPNHGMHSDHLIAGTTNQTYCYPNSHGGFQNDHRHHSQLSEYNQVDATAVHDAHRDTGSNDLPENSKDAARFSSSATRQGKRNQPAQSRSKLPRPKRTFAQLIEEAILSAPGHRIKLKDIYQYIEQKYEFYRESVSKPAWQNAIRHNLSAQKNKRFIRLSTAEACEQNAKNNVVNDNMFAASAKGGYWTLAPESMEDDERMYLARSMNSKSKMTMNSGLYSEILPMSASRHSLVSNLPFVVAPPNMPLAHRETPQEMRPSISDAHGGHVDNVLYHPQVSAFAQAPTQAHPPVSYSDFEHSSSCSSLPAASTSQAQTTSIPVNTTPLPSTSLDSGAEQVSLVCVPKTLPLETKEASEEMTTAVENQAENECRETRNQDTLQTQPHNHYPAPQRSNYDSNIISENDSDCPQIDAYATQEQPMCPPNRVQPDYLPDRPPQLGYLQAVADSLNYSQINLHEEEAQLKSQLEQIRTQQQYQHLNEQAQFQPTPIQANSLAQNSPEVQQSSANAQIPPWMSVVHNSIHVPSPGEETWMNP